MAKKKKHYEHEHGRRWYVFVDGEPLRDSCGFLLHWRERWAAEQHAKGVTGASVIVVLRAEAERCNR